MAKRQNNRTIASLFYPMRTEPNDLGFGNKVAAQGERLINRDGSLNVVRTGLRARSPYQTLLELSWGNFFLLVVLYYIIINAFFGIILVIVGTENISGVVSESFMKDFEQTFFFSIQTFTSVGYGSMSPMGLPAHIMSAVIALVGNISFALATGLFFARFSKPKAQIIFSRNALITNHKNTGGRCLQFRIVNLRNNRIINLQAEVIFTWIEGFNERRERKYSRLPLERETVTLLPLNWTLVHPIDENSPFYGKRLDDLIAQNGEILIQIQAHDETFAQTVHINSSYIAEDFLFDKQFAPMYFAENGKTILELDKIHDVV
ncbi:MAG: ion channel [Saprospiraceae bacterium]|nr:ion channel [Saprospiraceae bacterium]